MDILNSLYDEAAWYELIEYKCSHQHLSKKEEAMWLSYVSSKGYLPLLHDITCHTNKITDDPCLSTADNSSLFTANDPGSLQGNTEGLHLPLPTKRKINKAGGTKKRVIYSFPEDFNRLLKMIAFKLYIYDDVFAPNCYAFRRGTGVKDAVLRLSGILTGKNCSSACHKNSPRLSSEKCITDNFLAHKKYCLKADISNYFNSIDVDILLKKLDFLKKDDPMLFYLFEEMLTADAAIDHNNPSNNKNLVFLSQYTADDNATQKDQIIHEKRGAMAGTPVSPFFANVYLMDIDWYFHNNSISYFRYSDDILIFADTYDELMKYRDILYHEIKKAHLCLNPEKVKIYKPGDAIEFLGFKFKAGEIDISDNTRRKMKARIKRKSEALRRWARKKHLPYERAAKGFIKAINHKLYDSGDDKDFSWSRWFFPNLTTAKGLAEIDEYMQEYIRYCVTGRHYKGNYRITYEQMKAWGYRNLVHEYYRHRSGS